MKLRWLCRIGFHHWRVFRGIGYYFVERRCERCFKSQWYEPEHMIWMDKEKP